MLVHAGRLAPDEAIRSATLREVNAFAQQSGGGSAALALIETAGGPASPMPAGTLQVQPWAPAACKWLVLVLFVAHAWGTCRERCRPLAARALLTIVCCMACRWQTQGQGKST